MPKNFNNGGAIDLIHNHKICLLKLEKTSTKAKYEAVHLPKMEFGKMTIEFNDGTEQHTAQREGEGVCAKRTHISSLIIKLPTFIGNVKSFPILSEICFLP